jgi:hypothetical protein
MFPRGEEDVTDFMPDGVRFSLPAQSAPYREHGVIDTGNPIAPFDGLPFDVLELFRANHPDWRIVKFSQDFEEQLTLS